MRSGGGIDDRTGSLTPGKEADLIMICRDHANMLSATAVRSSRRSRLVRDAEAFRTRAARSGRVRRFQTYRCLLSTRAIAGITAADIMSSWPASIGWLRTGPATYRVQLAAAFGRSAKPSGAAAK